MTNGTTIGERARLDGVQILGPPTIFASLGWSPWRITIYSVPVQWYGLQQARLESGCTTKERPFRGRNTRKAILSKPLQEAGETGRRMTLV